MDGNNRLEFRTAAIILYGIRDQIAYDYRRTTRYSILLLNRLPGKFRDVFYIPTPISTFRE